MQRFFWSMAFLVVLMAGQIASAQFTAPARTSRSVSPTPPFAALGKSFRLSDLFPSMISIKPNRGQAYTSIPKPGTPEYLKAFGYKKLY